MSFQLEYCKPEETVEREPICEPVMLRIDHPFRDKSWLLVKQMPERRFFLLATTEGQTIILFETEFSRIQQ